MKLNKKSIMLGTILAIVFVAYNVVVFTSAGFTGNNAVFWTSWIFMILAFVSMAVVGVIMGESGMTLRDWLFGYPIFKHTTIFITSELIVSVIFMLLQDKVSFPLAFVIQFILLCVYLVFAISCFLAKTTIEEVNKNVKDKTIFVRTLRVDVEMLAQKCPDSELKALCQKLAEEIRYSDPMSNEALFELEKDIALAVSECENAISMGNFDAATALCNKATELLAERNKKCLVLK